MHIHLRADTEATDRSRGGRLPEGTQDEKNLARRYRRFYLALQLRDLCNERPIHSVARAFDMPRGSVQVLSQTSQGFAAGMIKFCEVMGWGYVKRRIAISRFRTVRREELTW